MSALVTLEQMRADIAEVLDVSIDDVVSGENLVDIGLDSIRIMTLAARWSRPDAPVDFADLAEYPEVEHWWATISQRHSSAG